MAAFRRISAEDLQRRRWELLALTSIGAFMSPLDASIVSVALPVMGPELRLSFGAAIWVQAAYLLAMAVLLIPLGRLADHRGRVRFYLLGIAVFTAGSLLSALSMSDLWLIAGRIVQGAGAALLSATAAAIVTSVFPPRERGMALGINVMAIYVGLSVGPPLGGLLVETLGWRWIFLVNLPIGVLSLIWGWLLLPRGDVERRETGGYDLPGSLLLGAFLLCLLVPLTFIAEWGWGAPQTLVLLGASALSLAGFVAVELRARAPVLDLDLLRRNRLFAAANTAALLNYMALNAVGILTAVFLEVVQGRPPGLTGWLMLGQPVVMAVLSPFSGRLSDRIGSRVLTTGGMILVAAGMVLMGTMGASADMLRVVAGLAVIGLGMAAFSAPNTSAIMGSVERHQLSLASAFLGTMRVTGMALSFAVLGGVAASQLGSLGGRLLFMGQTGTAAAAAAAGNYTTGYRYAMFTGAVLALVGAAVSLQRGRRPEAPQVRTTGHIE
jgi:EmrB/QacA subfamily drug resistance transporter